jgi:hypothetical protein
VEAIRVLRARPLADRPQTDVDLRAAFGSLPVPRKDHTGINRFDPDTGKVVTGGLTGVPFDTGAEGANLFLPRIGLAYRLNDKTVLRGGYGQSADPRPFQDVRNAFPIANIWSMPAISFNGATNSFIPVTTLRQG